MLYDAFAMNRARKLSKDELKSPAEDVVRLSKLLTKGREGLPAAYLKDEGLRRAYLLYFLPANLHKIHIPLEELSLHPKKILSKERLRVLDIGSGPGTAVLGSMEFFVQRSQRPFLEFTAVDQVVENLREAEELFRRYREAHHIDASLHTVKSGVEGLGARPKGNYELIILSNLLNELVPADDVRIAKRVEIVKTIMARFLAPDGSCIIIEPALRETSREMLMVRDGLLNEDFHVYSPCLAQGKCPALANPKDWCHEDVPWDAPELVKEIDKRIGLRKDSLKFSYLVIRKDNISPADIYGADSFRVVSEPLISKGKIEFYICGKGGRRPVIRLEKDATSTNAAFVRLRRGDVVGFEGLIDEGKRFKAGKGTKVIIKNAR